MSYGPIAIALSAALTSVIGFTIGLVACQMYLKYPVRNIFIDVMPSFLLSLFVGIGTYPIIYLNLHPALTLITQSFSFVIFYLMFSRIINIKGYLIVCEQIVLILKNRKNENTNY